MKFWLFQLLSIAICLFSFTRCAIDWENFNEKVISWATDFHNHLQSVKCLDLNLDFKNQAGRKNRINRFEFDSFQIDLFENLIIPFDKNPIQKVLRLKFEKISFKLEVFGYPEIPLRFRKIWIKMLFNVENDTASTKIEKIRISFEKLEWDDQANPDMKGDADHGTFQKMKNGIKELEPGFAKAFTAIFRNNYQRIYDFLENKEYEKYDFGDFLKLIFENYDAKNKTLNISAEWLRGLVDDKEKFEKEIQDKLKEGESHQEEKKEVKAEKSEKSKNTKEDL